MLSMFATVSDVRAMCVCVSSQFECFVPFWHGWAFAIVDDSGKITAAASGTLPWWISSTYGAELWALLQGALCASPGSPLHVDCNAVRLGAQNGTSWAGASSRKLARAWIPLANILEDNTDAVVWLPAHCNRSAIGERELSNGRKFDSIDLRLNDFVDTHAKREARASPPSRIEQRTVNEATSLVEGLAKWIGLCTREANHFPAPGGTGGAKFIRDSTSRRCNLARVRQAFRNSGAGSVKRKAPSSTGVMFVAKVPKVGGLGSAAVDLSGRSKPITCSDSFSRVKRPKLSHKQIEEKADFVFMEYWLAQREHAPRPSPPPVSAADRTSALRARVAARGLESPR